MGGSYSAYLVVGMRIQAQDVYETKKVKAFPHNHPEDWEVDPKTSRKLWNEESHLAIEEVTDDAFAWLNGRANNAKAVAVHSQNGDNRGEYLYIGRHVRELDLSEGQEDTGIPAADLDLAKEKKFLELLLGPFWEESDFGIWIVGSVTC